MGVEEKIKATFEGQVMNLTEERQVLHVALRMERDAVLEVDGQNVVEQVWEVLDKVESFSNKVRNGEFKGYTGKKLKNTVAIGIGGSYLGPEFLIESLREDRNCKESSKDRTIRFLSNVDPTDFTYACKDLDFEETLFIVNSKTFTTAETMLNARTMKSAIIDHYKATYPDEDPKNFIKHHFAACATNIEETDKFGIDSENVFAFWNWVGGRFSVTSCIGMLVTSVHYGFDQSI